MNGPHPPHQHPPHGPPWQHVGPGRTPAPPPALPQGPNGDRALIVAVTAGLALTVLLSVTAAVLVVRGTDPGSADGTEAVAGGSAHPSPAPATEPAEETDRVFTAIAPCEEVFTPAFMADFPEAGEVVEQQRDRQAQLAEGALQEEVVRCDDAVETEVIRVWFEIYPEPTGGRAHDDQTAAELEEWRRDARQEVEHGVPDDAIQRTVRVEEVDVGDEAVLLSMELLDPEEADEGTPDAYASVVFRVDNVVVLANYFGAREGESAPEKEGTALRLARATEARMAETFSSRPLED